MAELDVVAAPEEWLREQQEELDEDERRELAQAVDEQLLSDPWEGPHSSTDATRMLLDFEHRGTTIFEPTDWNLTDWDYGYLWCCHAIVFAIGRYRHAKGWS